MSFEFRVLSTHNSGLAAHNYFSIFVGFGSGTCDAIFNP
jgi:hypothetical protein